jgi:hypothetical protein
VNAIIIIFFFFSLFFDFDSFFFFFWFVCLRLLKMKMYYSLLWLKLSEDQRKALKKAPSFLPVPQTNRIEQSLRFV